MKGHSVRSLYSGLRARRRGLSVVEVLISLAIAAMLLTAVAAAFTASASVIQHNDQFFRISQAARVSLNQILTEIRRAQAVSIPSSSQVDMITYDSKDRSYIYDSTTKQLNLYLEGDMTKPYCLASNVSGVSFQCDTRTDNGGIVHVVRISVTLIVEIGADRVRLSGSAAPRKEQTYE